MTDSTFTPDWVSPPGDTISDLLDERGWSQVDLANRTGVSKKHVNELVRGKAPISSQTAAQLSAVLGSSVEFWLTREAKYRAALERRESNKRLDASKGWLKELPVAWMVKLGWIKKASTKGGQVAECLRFFEVANVEAWRSTCTEPLVAFRASTKHDKRAGAVAAWLRKAEMEANKIECAPFNLEKLRAAIDSLRALVVEPDPAVFIPRLKSICASVGVAVVLVPAPPGCPVYGAAQFLRSDKALLALSLRDKTDDHFWFAFFHECGHLLKHGKSLLFVEGLEGLDPEKEAEADRFAAELLIPAKHNPSLHGMSAASVVAFATQLNVSPGVVVGRMQKLKLIPYSGLNHLKQRYAWSE